VSKKFEISIETFIADLRKFTQKDILASPEEYNEAKGYLSARFTLKRDEFQPYKGELEALFKKTENLVQDYDGTHRPSEEEVRNFHKKASEAKKNLNLR
jgi:hypothetical protein